MTNNDCRALWVGLLGTGEIARVVASNSTKIDLPMWLRSEPYLSLVSSITMAKICDIRDIDTTFATEISWIQDISILD